MAGDKQSSVLEVMIKNSNVKATERRTKWNDVDCDQPFAVRYASDGRRTVLDPGSVLVAAQPCG